ncbi:MAG: Holliday junction resolvase RuvX [bacterium]|nr:Holliday junction resolvase RuvX [bacterium]
MRFLAIDPGGRRFGVARGDDDTGFATPLEVVEYRTLRAAATTIAEKAKSVGAAGVVIGLPTNADGEETDACARSRALAREIEAHGITTHFQPEYLSTNEARRRARQAGRRKGQPVDDLAAQVILEEYFSSL